MDTSSPNLVFSPLSLHVALSMLAAGATDASQTQTELLRSLGRFANVQALESKYSKIVGDYKVRDALL